MVRIVDDIGTVHSVKVRAESLYEATLLGLNALSRVGWEGDGETVGSVLVEVHYEPTSHEVASQQSPSNDASKGDWTAAAGQLSRYL
ncbi:MAG TPA: hypothetical protein VKD70_07320 [Candidatus Acidoferrum sp.]|nr:hypothetical protein [Candidatus Acidoferrum sp.]